MPGFPLSLQDKMHDMDLQDFEGYEVAEGKKNKDDFGIYNDD